MNKPVRNNLQHSKLVLEELEERRLFSGGIEGLIDTRLDSDAQVIYLDADTSQALQSTNDGNTSASAVEQQSHEIVFIDDGVDDYQQLVDDIYRQSDSGRNIEVVILDGGRDGIEQISAVLQGRDDLDAIHIISHGSDGSVKLGNTSFNSDTLAENNSGIALWANSFAETGDILIYGCNLAQSEVGKSLINELSSLTLTDVAASDDLTGHAGLGGDWALEFNAGSIEASVALSDEVQAQWSALLAPPVANNDSYSVDEDQVLTISATPVPPSTSYNFDEGSGQTITDNSGSGADGTLGNGSGAATDDPTWTTSDRSGGSALQFDGVEDYVQTTSSDLQTAMNFTLSTWFQVDKTSGQQHIIWQGVGTENGWGDPGGTALTSSEMHLTVGHHASPDNISFFLGWDDALPGSISIISSNTFTDTSQWHHASVVVTDIGGGSLQADLYIDGVLEGSDTGDQIDRSNWDTDLRIGQGGASIRNFDGTIDEVSIWTQALTPAQINELWLSGVMTNDTDADGSALSASLVTGPSNGSLNFSADGSFEYTPDADFNGVDSFTYLANDGTTDSNIATVTITVNPINDPPTISLPGGPVNYSEGDPATLIDAAATVGDPDSADFAGGSLTITLTANATVDDRLAIESTGGPGNISIQGSNVRYNSGSGPTTIGTFSGGTNGSTPLVITLDADANLVAVEALLQSITYENVSAAPSQLSRTVQFMLTDGDGGTSSAATETINLSDPNLAPSLKVANPNLSYTENDPPLAIDSGLTLTDADDTDLVGATVSITAGFSSGEDQLLFTDQLGISGSYDAGTGILTLTGSSSVANYQTALQSVTYQNGSGNPNTTQRTVTIVVNDGFDTDSDARNINIIAVDNAPLINDATTSVAEDAVNTTSITNINEANTGNDTDLDGDALTYSITGGNVDGIFAINAATGEITVTDNTNLDYETTQQYVLTIQATDGTNNDTAAITIDVTNVNDNAPTVENAIADQSATEDTPFNFQFASNVFGDADGDTLTYTSDASGWLSFDALTRTFTGTPTNADIGITTVTVTADDGSSSVTDTFTLTVINVNDPPVFGGVNSAVLTEDVGVVGGNIIASGTLTVTDPDVGESSFQAGVVNGSYGNLTIDAAGNWNYVADNSQAAIQSLDTTESLLETLTVTSFDGTPTNVLITINGAEDAPVIGGAATGTVAEDGTLVVTNGLTISDVDSNDNPISFNDVAATLGTNGYGNFEIASDVWTYTLNNAHASVQSLDASQTLTDTYTFTASDGSTQLVTVTINGAEDAAPISPVSPPSPEPLPVSAPPVIEPPPASEPDPSPVQKGAVVGGIVLQPITNDIVRVPQDPPSPSVREEIDIAAYLQRDDAETETAQAGLVQDKQAEKTVEQEARHNYLNVDDLTLQVSADEELNERYEQELLDRIDRMHRGIDSDSGQQNADDVEVQIIMGTTVGLTAGIVSWVLRGGSLLASLMSTVPLLNRFDPLPILKSRDEKENVEEDNDDEITDTTIRRHEKRVDRMFSKADGASE